MSWWVPLAVAAAVAAGVVIAFSLTAGRPSRPPVADVAPGHGGRRRSRYQEDNQVVWNLGAFVAAAGLIALLVLVGVLVEVL